MLILSGLAALVVGAELLVRASARLARRLGVAPMIIGLTIVAIGTSAPELAIGIDAALIGAGDIVVGNIAGTNVVNLMLILGFSALLRPLPLHGRTLRLDLPMMSLTAVVLLALVADRRLSRLDGALLVAIAVGYTVVIVRSSRRESADVRLEYEEETPPPAHGRSAALIAAECCVLLAGIVVIVTGADWLVNGAVDFARRFGVSEAVIGLTIVAVGTSAPEFATMVVATIRDHRDVAVGNLIGSSVYNIALILGVTALVPSDGVELAAQLVRIDLPLMVAAVLVCVPAFVSGRELTRLEGGSFVLAYLLYLGYLLFVRT